MRWGSVELYCSMCGVRFKIISNKPSSSMHHREYGTVCSKGCFDLADRKYTRMILGKDDFLEDLLDRFLEQYSVYDGAD